MKKQENQKPGHDSVAARLALLNSIDNQLIVTYYSATTTCIFGA